MAPQVGLEPTTLRLTAECSAIELLRSVAGRVSRRVACAVVLYISILPDLLKTFGSGFDTLVGDSLLLPTTREVVMARRFAFALDGCLSVSDGGDGLGRGQLFPEPDSAAPPKAKVDIVEETIHGHKIADPYRWLEDASSADSQEYVRQELAYTRSILDPLPGRDQIHQRLTQLLSIGTIGTPQIGGPYYFYTRREGTQNQPVLLVREGLQGKDRALVDPNQLSSRRHGRAGLVVSFR